MMLVKSYVSAYRISFSDLEDFWNPLFGPKGWEARLSNDEYCIQAARGLTNDEINDLYDSTDDFDVSTRILVSRRSEQ